MIRVWVTNHTYIKILNIWELKILESLFAYIVLLISLLVSLIIFKNRVRSASGPVKLGIFSLIIAVAGGILEYFVFTGYLITGMSMVIFITCMITKVYEVIFGGVRGPINILTIMATFAALSFEVVSRSIIELPQATFLRNISIATILIGVVLKAFAILFLEKEELNSSFGEGYSPENIDRFSQPKDSDISSGGINQTQGLECLNCKSILDDTCKFCPTCGATNAST